MQRQRVSCDRAALLRHLVVEVDALPSDPYVRVAVDGVDGAGRSVSLSVSLQRCVSRDGTGSADPAAAVNRRYVEGQRLYLRDARPREAATHVIDDDDLEAPVLVR